MSMNYILVEHSTVFYFYENNSSTPSEISPDTVIHILNDLTPKRQPLSLTRVEVYVVPLHT